jgi:L-fuculose-phosphate aldolase
VAALEETVEALAAAGREAGRKGLTWGASGNISFRVSTSEFLISASGVPLDRLDSRAAIRCTLDGVVLEGSSRPSVETRMHAEVYRARPEVGSVLHASPFYTTVVAASSLEVDPNLTTDSAYFLRDVRRVPFRSPGSRELAEAAAMVARHCDALLLDNHGALTLGSTPAEAVIRMEALEILCHMLVYASLGIPLRPLSAEQVDAFVESLSDQGTV